MPTKTLKKINKNETKKNAQPSSPRNKRNVPVNVLDNNLIKRKREKKDTLKKTESTIIDNKSTSEENEANLSSSDFSNDNQKQHEKFSENENSIETDSENPSEETEEGSESNYLGTKTNHNEEVEK